VTSVHRGTRLGAPDYDMHGRSLTRRRNPNGHLIRFESVIGSQPDGNARATAKQRLRHGAPSASVTRSLPPHHIRSVAIIVRAESSEEVQSPYACVGSAAFTRFFPVTRTAKSSSNV
jgi:hypothetical protein